jgi:hypothetical protein
MAAIPAHLMKDRSWSFDELNFEFLNEFEKAREEWFAYSSKSNVLNEMLLECYAKKDFESETVKFIQSKLDIISQQEDKFYDIQKYLQNLKNGYHFNVRSSVGRIMKKYDLTAELATLFVDTFRKHLSMFERESEAWKKRTIGHVEKIEWNEKSGCLHVHFDDGEWWHYDRDGKWW